MMSPGIVVGDMSFQGVDRLEDDRAGLGHCGLISQLCSHDKGCFGAVHGVVAAVQQGGFQADHRITGQHALLGGKADRPFQRPGRSSFGTLPPNTFS